MLKACSHLVLATEDVPAITSFFEECFAVKPHFANKEFAEFVLPSRFRIAFFKPVGASAKTFSATGERSTGSFGLTVENVDTFYARLLPLLKKWKAQVSGEPKSHSWGEKSFLLTDRDGNRWEIAQSPSSDGMLVNR